ncbi:MAG: hypothetical protein FJZ87_15795 [Chloroflexi bacterium]|nr:hypothetical protein [Chloroflexota bacterium]
MRVTRESLIRIARETAQERAYNDHDIVAAYLTGSLLHEDPFLGGTADIDIVFVHNNLPTSLREFVKLTPDFHIDISRRAKDQFKSPRDLRGDPWLGHELYAPILLYEREKFFDFVQAGVRAGFDFEQPPLILQRCRRMLSHARQIWMDLLELTAPPGPKEVRKFMKSLFHAVNTVAELSGPPIHERRLLLEFPARAEAVQKPGLAAGAFGLIGGMETDPQQVKSWIADWRSAFVAASEKPGVDARIHPARLNYYEKSVKAMLEGENPIAALWPLIHTWTLAADRLGEASRQFWEGAVSALGLFGVNFEGRVQGLDQYIDGIEILLDELAAANGVDSSQIN